MPFAVPMISIICTCRPSLIICMDLLVPFFSDTSTAMRCVNECPDRPWKGRMSVLLDPLNYACSGSDLLDHVNCFRNVYRENKGQCQKLSQCQEHRDQVAGTAYQTMMSLAATPTPQSANLVNNLMKHICNYVECANDCGKPEIIAKCGQEAKNELLLFFRRSMTSIKTLMSLYYSAITNSELKFDDTCDRLGTADA